MTQDIKDYLNIIHKVSHDAISECIMSETLHYFFRKIALEAICHLEKLQERSKP
jgi:hypothetical protein